MIESVVCMADAFQSVDIVAAQIFHAIALPAERLLSEQAHASSSLDFVRNTVA